jgi:hypothetical protein
MYTFSNRLKIFSIVLIILGAVGWGISYNASHHVSSEDVEVLLNEEASHHGAHDEAHVHDAEHVEHVMHQIHNRPYAALYVAAFFLLYDSIRSFSFLWDSIRFASRLVASAV